MLEKKDFNPSLLLAAIGIVFGDIGTSPLYAFRETLAGIPVVRDNILGALSLIFWSLNIIISIKYLSLVLRADNKGEGGILALFALLKTKQKKQSNLFFYIAIAGTALLVGDGMITPAISVLSAVEGVKLAFPAFAYLTIPITIAILVVLFINQHHGTAKIGALFGPVMLIWFLTMAIIGCTHIFENPQIINAVNPYFAVNFFAQNGLRGYALLGSVFLAVTGGEALYADLGQFGRTPIRLGWFSLVLPSLLLNYFGQGAYLLAHPEGIINPFYASAPAWVFYPLVVLATLATIIASQAVISATFSLTSQAVLLDLYPKVSIIQTSKHERGQVYVPQMNSLLAIGALSLVIAFRNSSALAQAYGIAVNLVMLSVTILVAALAYRNWRWPIFKMIIFIPFLFIELIFLGANAHKLESGGLVPIIFAALASVVMLTWHKGMNFLRALMHEKREDLSDHINKIQSTNFQALPHILAVFIVDPYDSSGESLFHYLKLNLLVPEKSVILSINIEDQPSIEENDRFYLTEIIDGTYRLKLHYGFMEAINIPKELSKLNDFSSCPIKIDPQQIVYLVENTQLIATKKSSFFAFSWQEQLFAFLLHNSHLNIGFYELPYERTIKIGSYFEI